MNNLFDISGKNIVITGAGGVLCGQMAKDCAKAGAKVAVLDLNEAAAQQVVDEIKIAGGEADSIGDVSTLADPSVVEHLVAEYKMLS